MALSIRDPETDRLARLDRTREAAIERRRRAIDAIVARAHELPVLDDRTPEEIIGYDENGLPS